jgi:CHAT domain-containing protein
MPKLTLVGKSIDSNPEPRLSGLLNVQTLNSYSITPTRDAAAQEVTIDAPDNSIVKVEYENEVCEWLRADQFAREIGGPRGVGENVVVPRTLNRGVGTRGVGEWVLKALHVMGISPIDALAHEAASSLAAHYEAKLQTGLYRLLPDGSFGEPITKPDQLNNTGTYLVFLHGTASSTKGSFGGFWTDEHGQPQATPEWNQILSRYKDRILALEHATFSVSPAQNALDVATLLPGGATVHLISHSRGGLVGELLCLDPPKNEDLTDFGERGDRKLLLDLRDVLLDRQFQVQKFVRTACPAVGTILAGKRMDLYLNILLNVVGHVPILGTSLTFDVFKAFALELIKMRADPASIPGIEAMMPESPFIHFLNTRGKSNAADVGVIAGNFKGEGFWGKLKSYALRVYYREQNDIVVNTASMKGGMARKAGVWEYFDEGNEVNHFHYFRNERTRSHMWKWLSSPAAPPADFQRVRGVRGSTIKPIRNDAPLVFLVPDVFASQLKVEGTEIWLNYDALASGNLSQLGNEKVEVGEALSNYQGLLDKLSSSYNVQIFPYDWRKAISETAVMFGEEVKKNAGPVHFIGHGMGGLLLREFARSQKEVWQALREKGSKLIMLGTPNSGSWHVARMLWGHGELVRMLALLGRKAESEVVTLLQSFQGLLDLLPEPMFTAQAWQSCTLGHPDAGQLAASREWREQMAKNGSNFEGMFYVAGTAEATPSEMENYTTEGDGQVTYKSGTVAQLRTWYDINRAHGDLPESADGLLEILARSGTSKLQARSRARVATLDPQVLLAREQAVFFPTEEDVLRAALGKTTPGTKPTASTLRVRITHGQLREALHPVLVGHYRGDAIVSAEAELDRRLEQRLSTRFHMETYAGPLGTVEIVRAPDSNPPGAVVVGLGEVGELTTEKLRRCVLEACLRYALACAEDPATPKQSSANGTASSDSTQQPGHRSAALTSLLIGVSGGSFLSVRDSIAAITQGAVEANRTLARRKTGNPVLIDELEFIELFEDTAIEAAHAIAGLQTTLHAELQPGEEIDAVPNLRQVAGRRFRKPYDSFSAGWWRRIQIAATDERDSSSLERTLISLAKNLGRTSLSANGGSQTPAETIPGSDCTKLVFTALTDRARLEETLTLSQSKIAEALIADSTSRIDYDQNAAIALFELLVPNAFKEQARDSSDMVLMVDKAAAQYPWELLTDRTKEGEEPLAVQSGMIRQFKTRNWERISGPRGAREHNALVIGDTISDLPPLPGAQAEAQQVARLLESSGYYANPPLIRQGAGEIIRKLFAADYRIVHLAGHGIFTPGELEHTGMVLGNGMYLSPLEFEQMRVLPELVFVNCCHLGQFRNDKRTNVDYPAALAANIAQTLIQKGVKAVVAAGWAVDDTAARIFATTFYRLMLAGNKFGPAVKQARKEAYDLGGTNTWGAYQCYGNPDFALTLRASAVSADAVSFYSRRENLDELRDIASQARDSKDEGRDELFRRTQEIDKSLPSDWRDGEVLCLLGQAYKELGELSSAIQTLGEAMRKPEANAPVQAIEQWANCMDRYAGEQFATDEKGAREKWEQAQRLLENLNKTIGDSSERLSLLGALWKRRGQAEYKTNPEAGKNAFQRAAEYYRGAYELNRKEQNEIHVYSGLNWMALLYVSGVAPDEAVKTAAQECRARAQQRQESPSFWDRVAEPDTRLLSCLLDRSLEQHVDDLIRRYRVAFSFATPNEVKSVTRQWEFIQGLVHDEVLQLLIDAIAAPAETELSHGAAAAN